MPPLSRIPLQSLPAFRAAAELQNLRAAAREMHVTPSAISQQIAALEAQLGFALFQRQGRRVLLNPSGQILLDSVQRALAQLDAGVQAAGIAVGDADMALATVVRMTVIPSLAQRWLLPRIGQWQLAHPGIRLAIQATQQSVDLLREGLHVGIRAGAGDWPGLVVEPLFEFDGPLMAFGAPAAAARLAGAGPAAMVQESLLGDPDLWNQWLAAAGQPGGSVPIASFTDTGLMLQAAEHDLGITLARGLYTVDACEHGRLVALSTVALPYRPAQRFFLVYPPALRNWAPLIKLRAWLLDEMARSRHRLAATSGVI